MLEKIAKFFSDTIEAEEAPRPKKPAIIVEMEKPQDLFPNEEEQHDQTNQ
jgi:hypothetical protein